MSTAYARQEAGNHYLKMGMQPFTFATRNGWDAGAFSILKYVSRHRSKNGIEDLKKGDHFVELRLAELEFILPSRRLIPMGEYIRANMLTDDDAWALLQLESWVEGRCSHAPLSQAIKYLMSEYAGRQAELPV